MKKLICFFIISLFITIASCLFSLAKATSTEQRHKPATSNNIVNYAKNILLSIVDTNFRESWVIDPENWSKVEEKTRKIQKSFDSLSKVKIGSTQRDVRKLLKNPADTRNNGKIWIYGIPHNDGTYEKLLEVFFDDKAEYVTAIISFDPQSIVENIGVDIGDPIDKMIALYGEPVDEKDFIEDPDNKDYLGLYYLYPRSGIGFLIGQNKATKNLSVQGVLVFGKG